MYILNTLTNYQGSTITVNTSAVHYGLHLHFWLQETRLKSPLYFTIHSHVLRVHRFWEETFKPETSKNRFRVFLRSAALKLTF